MATSFKDSKTFLNYLKARYFDDLYRSNITEQNAYLASLGIDVSKYGIRKGVLYPGQKSRRLKKDRFKIIVDDLKKQILTSFEGDLLKDVEKKLSFGILELRNINATCYKSHDGKYAIVLNSGLIEFISRASKYHYGKLSIDSIELLSDIPLDQITVELLTKLEKELFNFYKLTGFPLGKRIFLKADHVMSKARALFLDFAETFIISHEIAHYLEGHFSEFYEIKDTNNDFMELYKKHTNHQIEYDADIIGLLITFRTFGFNKSTITYNKTYRNYFASLMSAVILFFELMMNIEIESDSHPPARKRLINILNHFFYPPAHDVFYYYASNNLVLEEAALQPEFYFNLKEISTNFKHLKHMEIEILTEKPESIFETLNLHNLSTESGTILVKEFGELRASKPIKRLNLDNDSTTQILTFSFQLASNVAIGIATNWLYDTLKDKIKKMWVDGKEVKVKPKNAKRRI